MNHRRCLIVEAPSSPWQKLGQKLESLKNRPRRDSLPPSLLSPSGLPKPQASAGAVSPCPLIQNSGHLASGESRLPAVPMNVLRAAGPESTALFTITVQESGRSPGRLVGQRHIMVPLSRLQSTHRRLLLAGDTILSVTRCEPIGGSMADPPPFVHPVPRPDPDGLSVSEAPSVTDSPAPPLAPQTEATAPQHPVDHSSTPAHENQTVAISVGEDAMVLLLSVLGVLILLTLQVMHHLAQQWATSAQARQRPDPPAVGVRKRELANC